MFEDIWPVVQHRKSILEWTVSCQSLEKNCQVVVPMQMRTLSWTATAISFKRTPRHYVHSARLSSSSHFNAPGSGGHSGLELFLGSGRRGSRKPKDYQYSATTMVGYKIKYGNSRLPCSNFILMYNIGYTSITYFFLILQGLHMNLDMRFRNLTKAQTPHENIWHWVPKTGFCAMGRLHFFSCGPCIKRVLLFSALSGKKSKWGKGREKVDNKEASSSSVVSPTLYLESPTCLVPYPSAPSPKPWKAEEICGIHREGNEKITTHVAREIMCLCRPKEFLMLPEAFSNAPW